MFGAQYWWSFCVAFVLIRPGGSTITSPAQTTVGSMDRSGFMHVTLKFYIPQGARTTYTLAFLRFQHIAAQAGSAFYIG
jgi:hypothetical protein